MKGTIAQILAANDAIQTMVINGGAPYKIVRGIQNLKRAFANEVQMAEDQQRKVFDEYEGSPTNDGRIVFPSPEKRAAFERAWEDIGNTEVEIDVDKVDLSPIADNIIFQNINADVDALSAFIDFGS